jgi:hypothetical protein
MNCVTISVKLNKKYLYTWCTTDKLVVCELVYGLHCSIVIIRDDPLLASGGRVWSYLLTFPPIVIKYIRPSYCYYYTKGRILQDLKI